MTKAGEHGTAYVRQKLNDAKTDAKSLIAIVGGTLIDGTGKPAVTDSTVIIQGNRIAAVGLRSQIKIPKGATLFDARGKTVLPGFGMHAHLSSGMEPVI